MKDPNRREFLATAGGTAAVLAVGAGAAVASPDIASEARRLLREWQEARAAFDRQSEAVAAGSDLYDAGRATMAEVRAAERAQAELVAREVDAEGRIAAWACRVMRRAPLVEGQRILVLIDNWAFPLEYSGRRPCCQDVLMPGDVLVIGGDR